MASMESRTIRHAPGRYSYILSDQTVSMVREGPSNWVSIAAWDKPQIRRSSNKRWAEAEAFAMIKARCREIGRI